MHSYFEVKIQYVAVSDKTGKPAKITELYLIDAVSFTEAEAITTKAIMERTIGDFLIKSISRSKIVETDYKELFGDEKFYKVKIQYNDTDPDTGKEKAINNIILVAANDTAGADSAAKELLKEMIVPFEIKNIAETDFFFVLDYA